MPRLVILSDTHGVELQHPVPDGDILVHCGDFSKKGHAKEAEQFARFLDHLPHTDKVFIAGNHDFYFETEPEQAVRLVTGAIYLKDAAATIQGLKFYGSPWTPEFFDWAFMLPRGEQLAQKWQGIPEGLDVLITHGPPHGILDYVPMVKINVGCEALWQRLAKVKPKVHAFGHIHEGYGTKEHFWEDGGRTLFLNASNCNLGYQGVNQPWVVDVEAVDQGETKARKAIG